ncbi:MAG: pyridoxamine 5'-phosphate oxidase family protein [Candidatus Odinarchaeota archaeon]
MERKHFTFSFIENQIRNKTFGVLTTVNQDGTPHSTGILYGVSPPSDKFALYFLTSKEYKKVRNIKVNPNVSLIIPFPHYYIRFAPSGTVMFKGKAGLVSLSEREIQDVFSKKRVLRFVIKQTSEQDEESLAFIRIKPDPKVLCFGVGYNVLKLRKGHRQGGYSVTIPEERL